MKDLPRHLGGHYNKTHLDEGSLMYLKRKFNIDTMLDVGCGPAGMVNLAIKNGIFATGIDGDYSIDRKELNNHVILHDYTEGKVDLKLYYDLIWSVEFLEHVPEKYIQNVFHTFKYAKIVFCTASPKKAKYHFNPQPLNYWVKKFKENNFRFLEKETFEIRKVSTMKREFVRNTGMIFKNKNL